MQCWHFKEKHYIKLLPYFYLNSNNCYSYTLFSKNHFNCLGTCWWIKKFWIVAFLSLIWGTSLVAQMVKYLPAMRETSVQSLGQEDPLEKEMATHSVLLPWKSHEWRSLVGYSPRGQKELDTTERLHFFTF